LIATEDFKTKFTAMCQMDTIPDISLSKMKAIKTEFMSRIVGDDSNPDVPVEELGNAGRLLSSWIDGALEYTILKHEVIVLRLKNNKVLAKIKIISQMWPKKKEFIEGAYKLLLFTKQQRKQVNYALNFLQKEGHLGNFMSFKDAVNRVLKKWYEHRI
jgi:hypothetical protein